MVVQGILALALALPTGLLFGVGYGTGVRIGYEQVYPLLFPKDSANRNVTPTVNNIKQINGIYNAIGGKEASQMGIAMGLQGAMEEIDRNPDFQALEALELRLSGRTQSRLGTEVPLKGTSISDFPLGSSLDPNSPNFNSELYILVKKQQAENAPLPADLGDKTQLGREKILARDPSPKREATSLEQQYNIWQTNLSSFQSSYVNAMRLFVKAAPKKNGSEKRHADNVNFYSRKIKSLSDDYRNPNNTIRKAVLRLRQERANGNWLTVKYTSN